MGQIALSPGSVGPCPYLGQTGTSLGLREVDLQEFFETSQGSLKAGTRS